MGFLDRAIRQGISKGVGDAISKAVEQVVTPKATELANRTAGQLDQAAGQTAESAAQRSSGVTAGLSGAFANLQRAAEGYATEMSKSVKLCPSCGQPAGADKVFCPSCGARLPEETVAQGAVCPSCGKQNTIGTRFCSDCGAKLPSAVAEEQAAQEKSDAALAQWDRLLPQYPKWPCGGSDCDIEQHDGYIMFIVKLESGFAAESAVRQYRELLTRSGFTKAGEYPTESHLYKMADGACYHCDTEHCFDGDPDRPILYFNVEEPAGGFYYVKPEPKTTSLKSLFGL